jgi:hypothetical protein
MNVSALLRNAQGTTEAEFYKSTSILEGNLIPANSMKSRSNSKMRANFLRIPRS